MNNELERMWKEAVVAQYYPGICLEGMRKTMKNLIEDSQSLGQDMKQRPSEYEAGVLTARPQCSAKHTTNGIC
jgi:hypothetical protein